MNRPSSLNRWMYVEGNPVNLTDPSGYTPNLSDMNGYAEGRSLTVALLLNYIHIQGTEIVYDFETMERATFTYTGKVDLSGYDEKTTGYCLSLISVSGASYASLIFGFDNDKIKTDYGGPSVSGQFEVNVPIPQTATLVSIGAGGVPFSSANPGTNEPNYDVFGLSLYLDISLGVSMPVIFGGTMSTVYTMIPTSIKAYNDIDSMAQDIRSGKGSPTILVLPYVRKLAADQAKYYRTIRR
jgi:hypothetical protein